MHTMEIWEKFRNLGHCPGGNKKGHFVATFDDNKLEITFSANKSSFLIWMGQRPVIKH